MSPACARNTKRVTDAVSLVVSAAVILSAISAISMGEVVLPSAFSRAPLLSFVLLTTFYGAWRLNVEKNFSWQFFWRDSQHRGCWPGKAEKHEKGKTTARSCRFALGVLVNRLWLAN